MRTMNCITVDGTRTRKTNWMAGCRRKVKARQKLAVEKLSHRHQRMFCLEYCVASKSARDTPITLTFEIPNTARLNKNDTTRTMTNSVRWKFNWPVHDPVYDNSKIGAIYRSILPLLFSSTRRFSIAKLLFWISRIYRSFYRFLWYSTMRSTSTFRT